jgi:hypothetical protein
MIISIRREIPDFRGIPPSPSKYKRGRKRADYGCVAKIYFPNSFFVLFLEVYQKWTVD